MLDVNNVRRTSFRRPVLRNVNLVMKKRNILVSIQYSKRIPYRRAELLLFAIYTKSSTVIVVKMYGNLEALSVYKYNSTSIVFAIARRLNCNECW